MCAPWAGRLLAFGINAAVIMSLHGFLWLWDFTSPEYLVRSGIGGGYDNPLVALQGCPTAFQGSCTISHSLNTMGRVWFSHISSHLVIFCPLIRAIPTDEKRHRLWLWLTFPWWHRLWLWLAFPWWLITLKSLPYSLAIVVSHFFITELCMGFMCSDNKRFLI